MDSLPKIRSELADICDKTANTDLGLLILKCVSAQIEVDKWCRNKTFLLYTIPIIAKVCHENKDLVLGIGEWLRSRAVEVVLLNEVPFMNDESDLDFLNRVVRLVGEKLREIGPVYFAGLVYIGQSLVIFICD